jgi:hypothetical protein
MNAMVDAGVSETCRRNFRFMPIPSSLNWYGYWEKFVYKSVDESLQNAGLRQVAYGFTRTSFRPLRSQCHSTRVSTIAGSASAGNSVQWPVQVINPQTMGFGMMGMEPMGGMQGYAGGMSMLDVRCM